jgi:tetratricopeptide (TPR) repeat protein
MGIAAQNLKNALQLAEQGQYPEALEAFRKLHDDPQNTTPGYQVLRRGYALTCWAYFGRRQFPPALAALEDLLQKKRQLQAAGDTRPELGDDIAAIERSLAETA